MRTTAPRPVVAPGRILGRTALAVLAAFGILAAALALLYWSLHLSKWDAAGYSFDVTVGRDTAEIIRAAAAGDLDALLTQRVERHPNMPTVGYVPDRLDLQPLFKPCSADAGTCCCWRIRPRPRMASGRFR